MNAEQAEIVKLVGATEVIHPEQSAARKAALLTHHPRTIDFLELGGGQLVIAGHAPSSAVGKTVGALALQERFGVALLAVDVGEEHRVLEEDTAVVVGEVLDGDAGGLQGVGARDSVRGRWFHGSVGLGCGERSAAGLAGELGPGGGRGGARRGRPDRQHADPAGRLGQPGEIAALRINGGHDTRSPLTFAGMVYKGGRSRVNFFRDDRVLHIERLNSAASRRRSALWNSLKADGPIG